MIGFHALLAAAAAFAAEPPACVSGLTADLAACDGAIAEAKDPREKAMLFFFRAYARNEKHQYEEAVRDLDESIRLDPENADAYHERAYTLGELSEYGRAVRDSDREVSLRPEYPGAYEERAFLRHRAGDLKGAFEDRARVVELKPLDAGSMLARGAAALWLGRFDDASRDTEESLRLARDAKDEKAAAAAEKQRSHISLWRRGSGDAAPEKICKTAMKKGQFETPGLVGDCTAAFLAARTPEDRAELLTVRSLAWLVGHQDQEASIADQVMAVAIEPSNPDWHANLGGSYVTVRHSWAGRRALDRSLAIKESWPALAQRAAARYNLNDPQGALADAKRSFELRPNEVALIVLGDLRRDAGDTASAKWLWMAAYHMGGRDDGLIARLKSIGVADPEREPKPK